MPISAARNAVELASQKGWTCTTGRYKYLAIHIYESGHGNAHGVGEHRRVSQGTTTAQESRGFVCGLKNQMVCAAYAYDVPSSSFGDQFFLQRLAEQQRLMRFS